MAKKLSVYLPDDLWKRAERLAAPAGEKLNASALVQRALASMLRERDARTAALGAGATIDRERFEAVLAGVRAGARAEFERGYASGLRLVEIIGFEGLRWIVEYEGIQEAIDGFTNEPAENAWLDEHEREFEDGDRSYEAFRAGADKAIEDVWTALRSDSWGVDPESGASSESETTSDEPQETDA